MRLHLELKWTIGLCQVAIIILSYESSDVAIAVVLVARISLAT